MLENLGRKFARFTTNQVVRRPRLWPLFRRLTQAQFNRIAPAWDEMRSDDAFAPLVGALEWLKYLSLFYYYECHDPIGSGVDLADLAVLAVATIVLTVVAVFGMRDRDLRG